MNNSNYVQISVIMGIYNCAETLPDAIESLLNQTYVNWKLIMCDDASSDTTYEIAKRYANKYPNKILLIRNETNQGLNITLNHCLKYVDTEYIARMDGDDESVPERFEKQVRFLQDNSDYAIVSSPMILFDDNGEWGKTTSIEFPNAGDVVSGSPICHAPVMMRTECMDKVCGYSTEKKTLRVEDVDLWIRLYANGFKCYNIQEPLYRMRNDKNALYRRKYKYRINSTRVRLRGCKILDLPIKYYFLAFEPMIIGLVPAKIRFYIRKRQNNND